MKSFIFAIGIYALLGAASSQRCGSNEFECDNGNCIPSSYVCDFDNDCGDGSDERQDCPPCPGGSFQCEIGGCIPASWQCDGDNDCQDWSDESEESCPCASDEVRCPTDPGDSRPGECIPEEYICDEDGIWDCRSGWDEANCTDVAKSAPKHRPVVKATRLGKNIKSKALNRRRLDKKLMKM